MPRALLLSIALLISAGLSTLASAGPPGRPRLLVLTDIGGDPDDIQSLRRLLLYANEFEIVGLVASASGIPGEVEPTTRPDLIHDAIDDYAAVVANLQRHADGFPDPDALRSVVRRGDPARGVANLGDGRATEGSNLIASRIEEADRPLHIAIWGGAHDLAQALFDLRARLPAVDLAPLLKRVRVYAIADQDKSSNRIQGTGEWIREHFPDLRYVESAPPEIERFTAAFRGMYQNDSRGGNSPTLPLVADEVAPLNQREWVEQHIRRDRGPLGANYPIVSQNPGSDRNTRGVKEGDTPSWFFVQPNGLGDPESPEFGGWGGRFRPDAGGHFIDAEDDHPSGHDDPGLRRKWTVARWRSAYQHEFAARMAWCVLEPDAANHRPVAAINGDLGRSFVHLEAKPGAERSLDASDSTDPDGHPLSFRWWIYREPTSYEGSATIDPPDAPSTTLRIPDDEPPGTVLHVILEVEDAGEPPLTSYRRILVRVTEP